MSATIKARPTIYNGIKMRSRLEAGFAAWLDRHHFEWEYEPYALATEDGQYLPDFVIHNVFAAWRSEPVTVFVEVKPDSYSIGSTREFLLDPPACDRDCQPGRLARELGKTGEGYIVHADDCAVQMEHQHRRDEQLRIWQQALIVGKSRPDAVMVVAQPAGLSLMIQVMCRNEGCACCGVAEWRPDRVDLVRRPEGRLGLAWGRTAYPWDDEYWKPGKG